MTQKIIFVIGLLSGIISWGYGETASIYRDITIIETAVTQNSSLIVPSGAYDFEFQPETIRVISTAETNVLQTGAKAFQTEYMDISNSYQTLMKDISKTEEDLGRLTQQNSLYEKLTLTLAQNTSVKFSETLDKYFNAYKMNQALLDDLKSKLKRQNEDISLKKKELSVIEKQMEPYSMPMKILSFASNLNGLVRYKVSSGWQPKYSINLDTKTFALDINFSPDQSLYVPIEQSAIFSFYWKPSVRSMDLKKLTLILTQPFVYNKNMNASIMKKTAAPAVYQQDLKAEDEENGDGTRNSQIRPELVEETSDTGIVWNIDKPFILEKDARISVLKNTPIDIKQTYYSIPSQSPWGFSVIELSNTSDVYILPGEASLLSKNTEVPGMQITYPLAPGSSYQFQGIETKSIQAERKVIRDFKDNPAFFRGTTIQTKKYQIKVKNGVNKEIEMNLLDRLPVPADNRIQLKNIFVTDKSDTEVKDCVSNKSGLLSWKFTMQPNESKTIKIQYSLEYPGELILNEREE